MEHEKLIRRQVSMTTTEYAALRRLAGNRKGSFAWFVWEAIREKIARDTALDPIKVLTGADRNQKP